MTHLDICELEARLAKVEARLDALEARSRKPARPQGPPARIPYGKVQDLQNQISNAGDRRDWDMCDRLDQMLAALLVGRKDEK